MKGISVEGELDHSVIGITTGRCQGTSLTSDIATDMVNCQDICAGTAGCMFFTFDSTTGICTLTQDCDTVDASCSKCTNGAVVMLYCSMQSSFSLHALMPMEHPAVRVICERPGDHSVRCNFSPT